MKIIRDTIHGDIMLDEAEISIIDTKEFQRLRRIKQLGLSYLTYPSANHTRFEHSLGTMYIMDKICRNLGLDDDVRKLMRLVALVHDLGHCPLSHTSEEVLIKFFGKKHEDLTIYKIKNSELKDIINKHYDLSLLLNILEGHHPMSKLISGTIDCDRLDYILRDSYHTGVAYGIIDLNRILNNVELHNDEVIFNVKSLSAIEGFLIARYLMNASVYYHHTTRIAERMLLKAIEINIEDKRLSLEDLIKFDDIDLFSFLRNSNKESRNLVQYIDSRKLYKRALIYKFNELNDEQIRSILSVRNNHKAWKRIEIEIAEDLKLDECDVLLDIPRLLDEKILIKINIGKEITEIENISSIALSLTTSMKNLWFVALYTKKEHIDRVKKINLFNYISS